MAALVALLLVSAAPLAMAQEDAGTTGAEPAVVISDDGGDAEDPAWTFRFLVPTVLVITAIALIITGLNYGVRVRGRYRVVR